MGRLHTRLSGESFQLSERIYFRRSGHLFLMRENDMFADMMDNFGFMQNHSFSVSGGSQRTSYRLSLGYTGEDGILVTDKDKFDRSICPAS
mgnify:CR=1 FL=1